MFQELYYGFVFSISIVNTFSQEKRIQVQGSRNPELNYFNSLSHFLIRSDINHAEAIDQCIS